ncbi:bacterial peptide chain release factor 1 (bRF-1) [Lachnospiraceae bacterium KH1T2]|nr:bacterial peptide chain release factor 1 (bRF-1) [Lachnospiraceae bacterium KH1T2]
MFEKLEDTVMKYEELNRLLADPATAEDSNRYMELMKEHSSLTPVVEAYLKYKSNEASKEEAADILNNEDDPELREMAKEELKDAKNAEEELIRNLKLLLIPKDADDDRNVIVEIRAGAGGDEAALFAAQLYRMYVRYAERHNYKVQTTDVESIGIGGMKYVSFTVTGVGAYAHLKYESGVHRVQRVPATESGGRIHTSTVTVAIMPEATEVEVNIDPKDCRIDIFRASGNGGQCVNTTDSAVRLTHIPTGIVISCQDEKSQLQNKAKAFQVLRAKLYFLEKTRLHEEEASLRKSQVGTGDRSEKIRTYNFPQSRLTDHRINLTIYSLDKVMDGELDGVIDALTETEQAEKLAEMDNDL